MNTQQQKHYLDILATHERQWIALSPDRMRVLAAGKSLQEVSEQIKDKKDVIVTYVLPQKGFYVPLCQYWSSIMVVFDYPRKKVKWGIFQRYSIMQLSLESAFVPG